MPQRIKSQIGETVSDESLKDAELLISNEVFEREFLFAQKFPRSHYYGDNPAGQFIDWLKAQGVRLV